MIDPAEPTTKSPTNVPTVSRVMGDTIIELVYDPEHRATALVVSRFGGLWNLEAELDAGSSERLIPYSPRNNLIANGCVLLPSKPESFRTKEQLLADIHSFLHRYVDLSPLFERIAAHYILLTWVYDAFAELPYLRLRGEYGTGKTRALIAIGSLCYKAFFAAGASTVSPIFHTLDRFGGTLVLDEADFRFSDATADLVKIFNNGTVRGLPVLRTIANRNREFNPAAFKVFGPKIVAMRGAFSDPALESRFLTEETGSRALRSDIPFNTPDALHSEALSLRNRLLQFRLCNLLEIKANPALASSDLEPRLNQISLPLLSLIDDEVLQADIHGMLRNQQAQIGRTRSQSFEGQVIAALAEALVSSDGSQVSVQRVAELFNQRHPTEYGAETSPRRIGGVIRSLRIETRKSHGNFVIPESERPKISAIAKRYGIDIL